MVTKFVTSIVEVVAWVQTARMTENTSELCTLSHTRPLPERNGRVWPVVRGEPTCVFAEIFSEVFSWN